MPTKTKFEKFTDLAIGAIFAVTIVDAAGKQLKKVPYHIRVAFLEYGDFINEIAGLMLGIFPFFSVTLAVIIFIPESAIAQLILFGIWLIFFIPWIKKKYKTFLYYRRYGLYEIKKKYQREKERWNKEKQEMKDAKIAEEEKWQEIRKQRKEEKLKNKGRK